MKVKFTYQKMQSALAQGSKQELLRMYQPCYEDLMLYCLGKCRNKEMAKDAAAETLQAFLEHPDPKSIPNLKAWLLSVAHNKALKMLDKQLRRGRILDGLKPMLKSSEEMKVGERMDLERLNLMVRNLLKLEDFQIWDLARRGFKDDEIAEELAIHPKTVANRKSMIRKNLRVRLSGFR